jgi:hypothetical protein
LIEQQKKGRHEMALIEIEWHPGPRQLRIFGFAALVASGIVAVLLRLVIGIAVPVVLVIFAVGVAIFACSFVSLKLTRAIYIGLAVAAMPIGLAVSFILLTAFYFVLLTPVAILFRLIGRDALSRRFDPTANSYWRTHRPPQSLERYFQQF